MTALTAVQLVPSVVATTAAPSPAVIVAAPDGSGHACTTAHPCALRTARDVARRLTRTMSSDIDVLLEDGTYQQRHTFRLTAADSGRNGHAVVYRAAPHANPVISGFRTVTGWHRVRRSHGVWAAPIPAGFDTRQLYVNGQRIRLATGMPKATELVQTPTGFTATSTVMSHWPHPSNLRAVFRGGNGPWTETSCGVAAVHGTTVVMAEPCWRNLHLKALGIQEVAWFDDPMGGFGGLGPWKSPTTFENAYPFLRPNRWTIDHVSRQLYVEPAGHANARHLLIQVPALQTLLRVAGTPQRPVHDLRIRGLTFSGGGWTAPDTPNGFPQMQADWYLKGPQANNRQGTCHYSHPAGGCPFASWTRTPANVVLTRTNHVSMTGNRFVHLGGAGLDVYGGSHYDVISGNAFRDISASGIQLGSTDDPRPSRHSSLGRYRETHNTIANNDVHKVAIQYLGGVGIFLGYTTHSRVTHNQVDHVPYTAISVGWGGWHGNLLAQHANDNINAHNRVDHNLLFDYMLKLGDGGAIYTNGSQATSWKTALHISDNVAYTGINSDFSLYTDAASQYIVIKRNFIYHQPFDSFNTGGCRTVGHIVIDHNYFAPGGPAYPCFPSTDVQQGTNPTVCEVPPPTQTPPTTVARAGVQPRYRRMLDRGGPSVNLVGPTKVAAAGGRIVISGSGFTPAARVTVGSRRATHVHVVSDNYIFATAPRGSGRATVKVRTSYGASRATAGTDVTYVPHPSGCIDYLGTNITTKLFTG